MPETLRSSQWVPFPVELVFAFFANPGNLPHLMPVWRYARLESSRLIAPPPRPLALDPALRFQSPAAGAGSEMAISFRVIPKIPLRARWLARITDFAWNSHFSDEQIRGPFASWSHRHEIVAQMRDGQSGTLVTDTVEYKLPLGPLGAVPEAIFIRRQMESMFEHRQQKLEEILPVAARQAARRD